MGALDGLIKHYGGTVEKVEVVCPRYMANCKCNRELGHEGAHHCHSPQCGGRWHGEVDDVISKIDEESRLPNPGGLFGGGLFG